MIFQACHYKHGASLGRFWHNRFFAVIRTCYGLYLFIVGVELGAKESFCEDLKERLLWTQANIVFAFRSIIAEPRAWAPRKHNNAHLASSNQRIAHTCVDRLFIRAKRSPVRVSLRFDTFKPFHCLPLSISRWCIFDKLLVEQVDEIDVVLSALTEQVLLLCLI